MIYVNRFQCPICLNDDVRYIGYRNSRPYCRLCLSFNKKKYEKEDYSINTPVVKLNYPLTINQQRISNELIKHLNENKVLIKAVCGAGKTEIIVELVRKTLTKNQLVGIIIPRRDLVIEIGNRMKQIFPNNIVTLVYGGHARILKGDIIILTAHQAYRYVGIFNVLIIDEIDAFPYKGNSVLKNIVLNTSLGPVVSLSATPSIEDENENFTLTLARRYHNYDLPVPKVILRISIMKLRKIITKFLKENKPVFVYVPTIDIGERVYLKLKKYFSSIIYVYASIKDRDQIMKLIRNMQYKVVLTTTVLERGVTYSNLQVVVYKANHSVWSKETLIQISGRVGRSINYPIGEVIFMSKKKNQILKEVIKEIRNYNDMQSVQ